MKMKGRMISDFHHSCMTCDLLIPVHNLYYNVHVKITLCFSLIIHNVCFVICNSVTEVINIYMFDRNRI